ncbi:MAG: hypothetical protein AAGA06_08435 [Pseudomonadota bacterium]
MSEFLSVIAEFFDKHLRKRPLLYKLIVGLGFLIIVGLFVRDIASIGGEQ